MICGNCKLDLPMSGWICGWQNELQGTWQFVWLGGNHCQSKVAEFQGATLGSLHKEQVVLTWPKKIQDLMSPLGQWHLDQHSLSDTIHCQSVTQKLRNSLKQTTPCHEVLRKTREKLFQAEALLWNHFTKLKAERNCPITLNFAPSGNTLKS